VGYDHGARLQFIEPGKPIQNAHIESFNARLREECLNEHVFVSLDDARCKIEKWRVEYNRERPHSSLGNLTPKNSRHGQSIRELGPGAHRSASSRTAGHRGAMRSGLGSKTTQFFARPQIMNGGSKNSTRKYEPKARPTLSCEWDTERG
jgi:hypothetical protein